MALLYSHTLEMGMVMPPFVLSDAKNVIYDSQKLNKFGLLIIFTCNHCPYALAIWDRLIEIAQMAQNMGIKTVAINPNIHPDYPDDSPEKMVELVQKKGIFFPYLVDETQEVARSFYAECTPDIYLLKNDNTLFYHGRLDDNWQYPHRVIHEDLTVAIMALAKRENPPSHQYPSMGCSIKWRL